MNASNKKQDLKKKSTKATAESSDEIKTDLPLSEKDEVKQAEEKTQSNTKKAKSNN